MRRSVPASAAPDSSPLPYDDGEDGWLHIDEDEAKEAKAADARAAAAAEAEEREALEAEVAAAEAEVRASVQEALGYSSLMADVKEATEARAKAAQSVQAAARGRRARLASPRSGLPDEAATSAEQQLSPDRTLEALHEANGYSLGGTAQRSEEEEAKPLGGSRRV